jgi:hypothetical protein
MELRLRSAPLLPFGEFPSGPGGRPEGRNLYRRRITIALHYVVPEEEWGPLEELPDYRVYGDRVYEIITGEVLDELFGPRREPAPPSAAGAAVSAGSLDSAASPAGPPPRTLSLFGTEIPRFADSRARLIYTFADGDLYRLLSQDAVFVAEEELSLILRAYPRIRKGVGTPRALPLVSRRSPGGERVYGALGLSRRFREPYIPLEDRWVRRESLEKLGVGPLGHYLGGEKLSPLTLKPLELLLRGSGRLRFLWQRVEAAGDRGEGLWVSSPPEGALEGGASPRDILFSHLEYLRSWGINGGVRGSRRREDFQNLAQWLRGLAERLEGGRVLVLISGESWNAFLAEEFPQPEGGSLTVPPGLREGPRVFDRDFRGIGIAFYEDLLYGLGEGASPENPPGKTGRPMGSPVGSGCNWDILFLADFPGPALRDPGGSFSPALAAFLRELPRRLTLGLFFGGPDFFQSPAYGIIKPLFALRGGLEKYEAYLFRDTEEALALPEAFDLGPAAIRRPPRPFPAEGTGITPGRVILGERKRFAGLRVQEFLEEQSCFFHPGKRAPFAPPGDGPSEGGDPSSGGPPSFSGLDERQKNYFFFWRRLVRQGHYPETALPWIILYARELVLLMGGTPGENFSALLGLWEHYRASFPRLDRFFPPLITGFAVLYSMEDAGFSLILKLPPDRLRAFGKNSGIIADLYLHRTYVEENNAVLLEDIRAFFPLPPLGEKTPAALARVLNGMDRRLRKFYGRKLFEYFYPPLEREETLRPFGEFKNLGDSFYSIRWISFRRHPPLLRFLDDLSSYLNYRFALETGSPPGGPPRLEGLWRFLADRELAFPGAAPPPEDLLREPMELSGAALSRLRTESDEVRDLLEEEDTPEDEQPGLFLPGEGFWPGRPLPSAGEAAAKPAEEGSAYPPKDPAVQSLGEDALSPPEEPAGGRPGDFPAALAEAPREALRLISLGKGREELEALARGAGTMAELLIDLINGAYLEKQGDLLIEILDEGPVITAEYKEELRRWAEGYRNE